MSEGGPYWGEISHNTSVTKAYYDNLRKGTKSPVSAQTKEKLTKLVKDRFEDRGPGEYEVWSQGIPFHVKVTDNDVRIVDLSFDALGEPGANAIYQNLCDKWGKK